MNRFNFLLMATWIPLYLAGDTLTSTWLWLHAQGMAGELNPLGVFAFTHYGFWGLLAVKVPLVALVSEFVLVLDTDVFHLKNRLGGQVNRLVILTLGIVTGFATAIVLNNALVMVLS